MKEMKMVEHKVKVSPAQIRKMMSGGAVTLKPSNFDPSARHMIVVMPNTSRRIGTAMRKGKGVRIMLKPNEDICEQVMEGEGFTFKSLGRSLSKGFKEAGRKIKKAAKDTGKALTSRKAINTYKAIGKEVLPIAKGVADAGIDAGSMALATYMGNPALAPVLAGTAKAGLNRGYSELGKQVGLDPNTPVPYIDSPEALQAAAMMTAEKNIRGRTKGRVREAGLAALRGDYSRAQTIGTDYLIDKKLSGVERKIAKKAQQGKYDNLSDLASDYAAEKLASAVSVAPDMSSFEEHKDEIAAQSGRGIGRMVRKTRKGLRVGGALASRTPAYQSATYGGALTGMPSGMRDVLPATAPSSIIQIGSPYQRINSASMSPFIAASPQLANKPISGGSFMAAGSRSGRGFMAAG